MSEQELVDVLSVHADSLKDGVDLAPELLAAKPVEEERILEPLLQLARRIKEALAPVTPPQEFVTELRSALRLNAKQTAQALALRREADKRKLIWVAAGVGGLVYFVSLTVVGIKSTLAMLSFVAGVLGWRSAKASVGRPGPTH